MDKLDIALRVIGWVCLLATMGLMIWRVWNEKPINTDPEHVFEAGSGFRDEHMDVQGNLHGFNWAGVANLGENPKTPQEIPATTATYSFKDTELYFNGRKLEGCVAASAEHLSIVENPPDPNCKWFADPKDGTPYADVVKAHSKKVAES